MPSIGAVLVLAACIVVTRTVVQAVDVSVGDFSVVVSEKSNVPQYSFSYGNGSTYFLQFNQVYEAEVLSNDTKLVLRKDVQSVVDFSSRTWALDGPTEQSGATKNASSLLSFNFTSSTSRGGGSGLNFGSALSEDNETSHANLQISVDDYQWSNYAENFSLVLELSFTTDNKSAHNFSAITDTYAEYNNDGYFSISDMASVFTEAGLALNVTAQLALSGNNLTIVYSHFPNGSLNHDSKYGVNTANDPASFELSSSSSGRDELLIVVAIVVVAIVVAALAAIGVVWYIRRKRQASLYRFDEGNQMLGGDDFQRV